MGNKAVSDTGPLTHLSQINELESLRIVNSLLIPSEVRKEFEKSGSLKELDELNIVEMKQMKDTEANSAGALAREYGIGLGESEAIVLAKKENISLIFTDDLDARKAAIMRGLEPHGSVGILLRAYREGIIKEDETLTGVKNLYSDSTLYLTSDLKNKAIKAVKQFSNEET